MAIANVTLAKHLNSVVNDIMVIIGDMHESGDFALGVGNDDLFVARSTQATQLECAKTLIEKLIKELKVYDD